VREGAVQVSEAQRARILAAMAHVLAEHGAGSVTVSRVVTRAGVSRRTFYDLFSSTEECFLGVFEDTLTRASRVVSDAVASSASSTSWRERVRAGLGALLAFFDEEPAAGSLLIVDVLSAGTMILGRRARVLHTLTAIVDGGRRGSHAKNGRGASPKPAIPSLTAEGVVGAVLSVIHTRMLERAAAIKQRSTTNGSSPRGRGKGAGAAPEPLLGLLNPLMGMIVLPYDGQAAARRELTRPAPKQARARKPPRASQTTPEDPLNGLNIRLTYRTLRVLSVIATTPNASNRRVADDAGIHDQGQISKLLTRLERLELIHNNTHGQPHGEPNAWTLTHRGEEIEQALRG
jgi:AcrR family transcriptional regulator